MKCKHCNKEVVLVPSAAERAAKDSTRKSAKYYTSLFPYHADCELALQKKATNALIERHYS